LIGLSKAVKNKLGASKTRDLSDVIEIGPHPALQRPIKEIQESLTLKQNLRYHTMLSRVSHPHLFALKLVGELYSGGYSINLLKVNQLENYVSFEHKTLLDLPEYPFNHSKSYWHEH
jgi:acyl transferase domain-containing protein